MASVSGNSGIPDNQAISNGLMQDPIVVNNESSPNPTQEKHSQLAGHDVSDITNDHKQVTEVIHKAAINKLFEKAESRNQFIEPFIEAWNGATTEYQQRRANYAQKGLTRAAEMMDALNTNPCTSGKQKNGDETFAQTEFLCTGDRLDNIIRPLVDMTEGRNSLNFLKSNAKGEKKVTYVTKNKLESKYPNVKPDKYVEICVDNRSESERKNDELALDEMTRNIDKFCPQLRPTQAEINARKADLARTSEGRAFLESIENANTTHYNFNPGIPFTEKYRLTDASWLKTTSTQYEIDNVVRQMIIKENLVTFLVKQQEAGKIDSPTTDSADSADSAKGKKGVKSKEQDTSDRMELASHALHQEITGLDYGDKIKYLRKKEGDNDGAIEHLKQNTNLPPIEREGVRLQVLWNVLKSSKNSTKEDQVYFLQELRLIQKQVDEARTKAEEAQSLYEHAGSLALDAPIIEQIRNNNDTCAKVYREVSYPFNVLQTNIKTDSNKIDPNGTNAEFHKLATQMFGDADDLRKAVIGLRAPEYTQKGSESFIKDLTDDLDIVEKKLQEKEKTDEGFLKGVDEQLLPFELAESLNKHEDEDKEEAYDYNSSLLTSFVNINEMKILELHKRLEQAIKDSPKIEEDQNIKGILVEITQLEDKIAIVESKIDNNEKLNQCQPFLGFIVGCRSNSARELLDKWKSLLPNLKSNQNSEKFNEFKKVFVNFVDDFKLSTGRHPPNPNDKPAIDDLRVAYPNHLLDNSADPIYKALNNPKTNVDLIQAFMDQLDKAVPHSQQPNPIP